MTLIFRNWTTFWDIPKWNRGQTKWDGGSIRKLGVGHTFATLAKTNKQGSVQYFLYTPR